MCGCSRLNVENKIFISINNNKKYVYSFNNNTVSYKYFKNNSIIKTNICKYNIETNNMIKVICDDYVELLLYDKDNNCIYDHDSRVYCIK
jgi:hypothetical protein